MRVLVIGGTGFIGREVARQAAASGLDVVLFNRGVTAPEAPHESLVGDVEELLEHRAALRRLAPDAIVHTVAHHERHAEDVVATFEGLDTRLLVLGSQDCYEAFYQVRQGRDASDFPLDESMPTCELRRYWQSSAAKHSQDYDKNLLTDALLTAHRAERAQPTVFRLPMVYGPHDGQFAHRHGAMIRHCVDRRERVVLGALEAATFWPFGYVENVAAAVLHALDHPGTVGGVYNIGERRFRTKRRWYELYGRCAGLEFEYLVAPDEWLDAERPVGGPAPHVIGDSSAFERDTGFREPVGLDDCVRRTYEWALEHPAALGAAPDYAAREQRAVAWQDLIESVRRAPAPGPAAPH